MKYRMYHLVMYNLSPIQQGIQAYHAGIEYYRKYEKLEFDRWADNDKTVIILNGGTSIDMEKHFDTLCQMNVDASYFKEPDLNNSMSAISFLVDERVWDKETYPDWMTIVETHMYQEISYNEWLEKIGGQKNIALREFLSQFKLA